jgi:hypothetical protein
MSNGPASDVSEELAQLEAASRARDWNHCRELVAALLARLPPADVQEVARKQVAVRLSWFERYHPTDMRPRILLGALERGELSGTPTWLEHDREGPGGNNYIGALEALLAGARSTADPERSVSLAVEAIASAIMTEKVARWGGRHMEDWRVWYAEGVSGEMRTKPALLVPMATDVEVAAADTLGWLAVEDELRQRLLR